MSDKTEVKPDLTIEELKQKAWGLTDEAIRKLEEAFRFDFTVREACSHAGIHNQTYYNWCERSREFSDRMDDAKTFLGKSAKQNIVRAITKDGSIQDSWTYLNKRQKAIYSDRQELTGADGAPISAKFEFEIIDKTEDIDNGDAETKDPNITGI